MPSRSRIADYLSVPWLGRSKHQVVVPPFVAEPARLGERQPAQAIHTARPSKLKARIFQVLWPALLFSPTLLAILYFGIVATPRYVSEATFVVRTATRPIGAAGFGALLQMSGLSRAQDDVFAVHDFLVSRDATDYLRNNLDILAIYGRPGADFLARYPSILYGGTWEQFFRFFQTKLSVSYSSVTGITTVQSQAFLPTDAKAVMEALLVASEQLINKMNARLQQDAIAQATEEVARNEKRLIDVQVAITDFRNQELMIDPGASSLAVTTLIGRLAGALAETHTQLREMSMGVPGNPQRTTLERRAEAIEGQIRREKLRISANDEGLATKLAHYEKLVAEREFAKNALAAATSSLESARSEARRQQLYLERIVEPNLPDYPTRPERLRAIATVASLNIVLLLSIWLVLTGIREHAQATPRDR